MAHLYYLAALYLTAVSVSLEVPLHGNAALGYYYANWYFGSQKAEQALIIDTGSFKTVIDCNSCDNCGTHIHPHFKIEESKTLTIPDSLGDIPCSECEFSSSYSEGSSYFGNYVQDMVTIGEQDVRLIFGCVSSETGLFVTQEADGISGIGPLVTLYELTPPTPDMELYKQGLIPNDVVSLCLSQNGGQLNFGEPNYSRHLTPTSSMVFDIDSDKWFSKYDIDVKSIIIDGVDLGLGVSTFIDSGTTYTYFEEPLYSRFVETFSNFCKQSSTKCGGQSDYDSCFNKGWLTSEAEFLSTFPTIKFELGRGNLFEWQPANYLINTDVGYCVGLEQGSTILGATFMKNYDFTFDKTNKRLTVTKAICNPNAATYKHRVHADNRYNQHFNQVVKARIRHRWVPYSSYKEYWIYAIFVANLLVLGAVIWYINHKSKNRGYEELVDTNTQNIHN